jgi:hypothetical protein
MSITRINDGWNNCLNNTDEHKQTTMDIEKSCVRVRLHRFRCSIEHATCLSVTRLGYGYPMCTNGFANWWFGYGRLLSEMNCNDRTKDECQRWWICLGDQRRRGTGQCFKRRWDADGEWDCADASDEYRSFDTLTAWTLQGASQHDFTNRSYFVPRSCPQSLPFLCLSSEATRLGFSCFNLNQIGDGRIDYAGAMDERNTLKHCSQSSMLGNHFLCRPSNTCISYYLHCSNDHRCPNRSDDEHWCSEQY